MYQRVKADMETYQWFLKPEAQKNQQPWGSADCLCYPKTYVIHFWTVDLCSVEPLCFFAKSIKRLWEEMCWHDNKDLKWAVKTSGDWDRYWPLRWEALLVNSAVSLPSAKCLHILHTHTLRLNKLLFVSVTDDDIYFFSAQPKWNSEKKCQANNWRFLKHKKFVLQEKWIIKLQSTRENMSWCKLTMNARLNDFFFLIRQHFYPNCCVCLQARAWKMMMM